ncbi:MAG: TonB-dependent receptor [Bacteroidetes bacterium]|nr:TonB-dependent receptor [Bacteroidota bacterium]
MKTLRLFYIIPLLTAYALSAYGQKWHVTDDTLFFALRDHVTVTASRLPMVLGQAPAATDVFTARDIERLPARSVSDVVALAPGATVRDYGGTGALQLASLRGLGAEYTLVLLNGMRLNGAQNALVDLGRLSLRQVDRIEIARGGLASLYGSNALGGVVNIVTARRPVQPALQLGYGAFGWKQAAFSAGEQGRAGRLFADLRYEEADNDFPFLPSRGGEDITRRGADIIRRNLSAGGTLFLPDATVSLYADLLSARTGTPGAVLSASQGRARQNDDAALFSAQLDWRLDARRILRVGTGGRIGRQEYRDPSILIGGGELHSVYNSRQLTASVVLEQSFTPEQRISLGLEIASDQLDSPEIRNSPLRRQAAAFAAGDIRIPLAGTDIRFFPSLRYDGIFDNVDEREIQAVTPSLGVRLAMLPGTLALRGRWSRGFSAPTFNQLYWREGGNPALRPEYSTAFEGGLVYTGSGILTSAEITAFRHDITDKIVWAPGQGIYWTPRNVQHVISDGVEAAATLRMFGEHVGLRLSGQWMSARKMNASFPGDATQGKQLIYVPEWSGAATLSATVIEPLTASATVRVLGPRWYTESNDASLPAHAVIDLAVTGRIELLGTVQQLKAEILNLLDASYEVIAFYPMPGRHMRLTLTTSLP